MNKTTLYRFSKLSGIPVNRLNRVLVEQLIGVNKDLAKTYRQLDVLLKLKTAAQNSGKNLDDIFMFCSN